MSSKRKKGNPLFRFFFNPKFLALVAIVALVWLSFPLREKLQGKKEIDKEIQNLKQEISELENKNQDLEELTKYLQSDQFVEEQARMNLGLKKKGEEVVVIKEEEG
ncbi:MAG TPA: septum formation initiator family protein, partial [Patescibacteria group bacterium]|nr:septum formation initiator family protein [Patescibacteria group bacterium]